MFGIFPKLSFLDQQAKWDSRDAVAMVASEIANYPRLLTLELRGNTLGVEAGEAIAEALQYHPELQHCLWSDLFTGRLRAEIPPILRSLCGSMMKANVQLVELDLSDNAFGPIGAESIKDFLESPSAYSLEILKLNNCGLGIGGKQIATSLIECHRRAASVGRRFALKTFVAGRNRLENECAIALAAAFQTLGSLEEITMHQNGIKKEGITALASAFRGNPNLKKIDLGDNTATQTGAHAISKALPMLHKLESLSLADCLCRDAGCHYIIDALNPNTNPALEFIDLSGSELTADAALRIAERLPKFGGNVRLKIECNNFGDEFELVRERMPEFVDCGETDDDQGSLDSDQSEHESDSNSEDSEHDISAQPTKAVSPADKQQLADTLQGLLSDMAALQVAAEARGDVPFPQTEEGTTITCLNQQKKWDKREDVAHLIEEIWASPNLATLELRGNTLGIHAGEAIADALENRHHLRRCLWSDLFTGRLRAEIPPILRALCGSMMKANVQLVELDLSDNAFGPIGAESIKEFLESPSAYSLEILKLNNCGLGIGGKQIATSLIECHRRAASAGRRFALKTFIAGRNRLENECAIALAAAFQTLGSLEEITMHQNGIKQEGITALAAAFQHNPNLKKIDLGDNTATELGAHAISVALTMLPKLESLSLADCLCRNAGCHYIIDALNPNTNPQLQFIDLSGSELSTDAALRIAERLPKFGGSVKLKIECNNFGDDFAMVKSRMPDFVDCGESEDDQGSLDSEDDERFSDED
ncbi:unnamed protein product, partial [Mesorhabditis spiculigera]